MTNFQLIYDLTCDAIANGFRFKVANKRMNVSELVEVADRKKDDLLASPAVLWIVSVRQRKSW